MTTCSTCGGELDPQTGRCPSCARDIPQIPGYGNFKHLGEGGMGTVFVAEETLLGRRVAVKVIHRRIAANPQSKARFLREARTMATVEHPHVVRVYSFGEVGAQPYLVMEYVEGETLEARIARCGKLPIDDALRITRDVVDALEAAWERNVIHRDIKPSNILIDRHDRVLVADFGLAKPVQLEDGSLTQSGMMIGTPHYVSPEQARDDPVDFRSDFYSLGVMLFHMLAGCRPFEASSPMAIVARHMADPMPSLASRGIDAPEGVEQLTRWMTEKDPQQRPASHKVLRAALDALLLRATAAPVIAAAPKRIGARVVAIAGVLLFALIGGFIAWRSSRVRPPPPVAQPESRFVVAVAPFFGPDVDSVKEGQIMAVMVERVIANRLGAHVRVIGIDETKTPLRSDAAAQELARRVGANAVVWGEALALGAETEIQPHVSVATHGKARRGEEGSPESAMETLTLGREAASPIELRKTTAAGVGDVVTIVAALHMLEDEEQPLQALAMFRRLPHSASTLRYQVRALLAMHRNNEARSVLEQAVALDPRDAPSLALLGDLYLAAGRTKDATAQYQAAAATKRPYRSSRGIFFEDKLYLRETYFAHGEEKETLYVLAMDPATQRIVARYSLPRLPIAFHTEGDALVVSCSAGQDPPWDIRFRQGRFERFLWPARFQSYRTWSNRDPRSFAGGLPLAEALARDPTQPWLLAVSALELRRQHRDAEADEELAQLTRHDFAGIPYYEAGWIMNLLEQSGERTAADRLYPRVLERRRAIPQPAHFNDAFGRLISAPFVHAAAEDKDVERRYVTLTRARELTGVTADGEEMLATVWARYFEKNGDAKRAAAERDVARSMRTRPFNATRANAQVDYAFTAAAAALIAFVVLFFEILVCARERAMRNVPRPRHPLAVVANRFRAMPNRARVAVGTLLCALMLYSVVFFFVSDPRAAGATLGWIAFGAVLLWLFSPTTLAAVTARERRVLMIAAALCVLTTVVLIAALANAAFRDPPDFIEDTIGHPATIKGVEQLLRVSPSPALQSGVAVAHHFAGDRDRAEVLYRSLPANYPHAQENLRALLAGLPPAVPLSEEEIYAGMVPSLPARVARAFTFTPWAVVFSLAAGCAWLLLLGFPFVPARSHGCEASSSRTTKAAMLAIPGLFDVRRGSTWRALALLLLIGLPLPILGTLLRPGELLGVGPMTHWQLPFPNAALPLPGDFDALRVELNLAIPYAKFFFALLLGAATGALALHFARVPRIVREASSSLPPTLSPTLEVR
jgi:tetratricopeptide (TPR) repeat protein